MRILLCFVALTAACEAPYEPTENYVVQKIEGWAVHVNKCLLDEQKVVGDRVLRLLEVKSYDINRVVPKKALEELHKAPIWVEFEDKDIKCMCYHPSRGWLTEHGFNPEKAKAVEIGNAKAFLTWTLEQPSMVLHELAHAYHHRVLGYDNPDIRDGYRRAVGSRSYESVLHYTGGEKRAYALNNDQEYFAELTEAFFGQNDFYPFVRAEVMRHDPQMYETLKKLWGEPKTSAPAEQLADGSSCTLEQQSVRQGLGSPVSEDSNPDVGCLRCLREQCDG